MEKEFLDYLNKIFNEDIIKIVVSNPLSKENKYQKIVITQKDDKFFASNYTKTQVFNENISKKDIFHFLLEKIKEFKQFNFFNNSNEFSLKISKKNKLFYSKIKNQNSVNLKEQPNRKKNYILNEYDKIDPLVDIGVFTKEYKIVASMQDKFKQINRFIEIIDDEIKNKNLKEIYVIDFGCGKSYLTFIIYYYLKFIRNIKPNIIGLDLKKDVIDHCNKTAEKYGYEGLRFEVGDINGFNPPFVPDMVVTLHACDTATDYALFNAISWKAKMIFSVPCCQHELNGQIKSDALSIINRYGIVQERVAALFTDIIRCNLLQVMGYKVQLLEFVDFAHSPKNLLIRANNSNISENVKRERLQEVENLMREFSLSPKLYNLLKEKIDKK